MSQLVLAIFAEGRKVRVNDAIIWGRSRNGQLVKGFRRLRLRVEEDTHCQDAGVMDRHPPIWRPNTALV